MVTAAASYLPAEVRGIERFAALAEPALHEACAPLLSSRQAFARGQWHLTLYLCLPPSRPGLHTQLAPHLARLLQERAPEGISLSRVEVIATGHAAGWHALWQAAQRLQTRGTEACLIGGIDSYLDVDTLEWLDANEQLKSTTHRWGFIPGEAAGFCLLASNFLASRYRMTSLLELHSVGVALEKNRIKTDTVCTGEGLTHALREVLRHLPEDERVDEVIGDLNGERYRADEYGFSLTRVGHRFAQAFRSHTPADCWGDVGAASGPLFWILAAASGLRGYARGPRVLTWGSSEGGERGAALFRIPVIHRRT